jgi:hypothetical protein
MAILPHEKRDGQWFVAWETLARLDPRLLDTEQTLIRALSLPSAEFAQAFRVVRLRISELVGWSSGRRHPVLRSANAYHIAVDRMIAIAQRREEIP